MQDLTRYLYRACYNNALVFVRNNQIHDTILNSIGAESDFTADDVYAQNGAGGSNPAVVRVY